MSCVGHFSLCVFCFTHHLSFVLGVHLKHEYFGVVSVSLACYLTHLGLNIIEVFRCYCYMNNSN